MAEPNAGKDGQAVVAAILKAARTASRVILYEHEVYSILAAYGQTVPEYGFISAEEIQTGRAQASVLPVLSRCAGERVVVKVVADAVPHKQKLGGVQIILREEAADAVEQMAERFAAPDYGFQGVLVVEFTPYSSELGNEILVGMRKSREFGAVVSFSKGGDDAELFADAFSPAEIFMVPVDTDAMRSVLERSPIGRLFAHKGRSGRIADLITLAQVFERISEDHPNLTDFEINPFVWDARERLLPLDGLAYTRAAGAALPAEGASTSFGAAHHPPGASLRAFFEPEGVAVVGVSAGSPGKSGNIIAGNLHAAGRPDLYCINAGGGEVALGGTAARPDVGGATAGAVRPADITDPSKAAVSAAGAVRPEGAVRPGGTAEPSPRTYQLYRSLRDLPVVPDLVIITVPAAATPGVVKEAAELGVKATLLIPGGFSELTGDDRIEREILSVARAGGMRLIGPNCLGVVYQRTGINTFFIPADKFPLPDPPCRNAAFITQSGALALVLMSNLRNALLPQAVVSYGNQIDVEPAELVEYFADDPDIDVLGVYIEGFSDDGGRRLCDAARRTKKPVIAYKAGRTSAGMLAAASHTASISGDYAVTRAAFRDAGIITANTIGELSGLMKTFSLLANTRGTGNRVVVISNAGYEKTNAADNFTNLRLAELDRKTVAALREILPPFVGVDPLLDITPMAGDDIYAKSLRLCLESDSVDAVILSIVPHSPAISSADSDSSLADLLGAVAREYDKPVVASVTVDPGSDYIYNDIREKLERNGIPAAIYAEEAVRTLDRFVGYRMDGVS